MTITYTKSSGNAIVFPAENANLLLKDLERIGFRKTLLLPIAAYDATTLSSPGKMPARVVYDGAWYPLKDWTNGTTEEILREALDAGGNLGLLTGVDIGDGWAFVAIDLDMNAKAEEDSYYTPRATQISRCIIESLERQLGHPIWQRHTVTGRSALLVRLPVAEVRGINRTIALQHPDFAPGQIEVRGTKRQIVIGGIHKGTHRKILWTRGDKPGQTFRFPSIGPGIPKIAGRLALTALLDTAMATLYRTTGVTQKPEVGSREHAAEKAARPQDKAPPSVEALIEVFDSLPHDARVDYELWKDAMQGAAGAIKALEELEEVTPAEKVAMQVAVIRWSARWDHGGKRTTVQAEYEKWRRDWYPNGGTYAGWNALRRVAKELGVDLTTLTEFRPLEPSLPTGSAVA